MLCLRQFLYLATVCACAAVWLCAPAVALAHDKWLEVEPGVSLQPAPAKIYLATGEALRQAELLPERRASRVLKFELRAAASVQDLAGSFREDAQPIAAVPALPAGSSVLRLDTAPIDIELSAEKFGAYLLDERLIDVLAERKRRGEEDAPGRERYSRNLKALTQVGDKLDAVVTRAIGQELELVPMTPPHRLREKGELAIKVLFRGQPLIGCAVSAAQRWRNQVHEVYKRTDQSGTAQFTVETRGLWLIRMVHMHRAEAKDAASGVDWRSHWASLSFAY